MIRQQPALLAYASGIGAANPGCGLGPDTLLQSPYFPLSTSVFRFESDTQATGPEAIPEIAAINTALAEKTQALTRLGQPFVSLGGDHSCAIGCWSGAAAEKTIGLIWVDAHMDSHTPSTSHSGNTHGMPLASLLGHGDEQLTHILNQHPKLAPGNVCLIGIRSYEPEEQALLESLGVRIYGMPEIHTRGFRLVWEEAVHLVNQATDGYGVSLDLDGIDPKDAPGVGTAEPDGIQQADILAAMSTLAHDTRLIGLDINEFNPVQDIHHRTEKLACDIIHRVYGNQG